MENNGEEGAAGADQGMAINRIAMKAPPFWSEEPELWFAQIEGQFTLGGITQDSTKYAYVLSQLEAKYAREIKDIVSNPPARDKYPALKQALIQRLAASQNQRIRQLLEHEELGDRKPSQFLRHLQTLAGTTVSDELLRTLWLGRLPAQMQVILATRTEDRLTEVANQADRIHEVTSTTVTTVAAASTTAENSPKSLETQIAELAKQVATLTTKITRFKNTERSRSRSRSRSRTRDKTCYYHRRFGSEAKKCSKPCDFKKEKNEEGDR
jgi:predicted unusual protein kinase regulating ubiquinone biosynthesis (AarF/ABC1/UbiB family)